MVDTNHSEGPLENPSVRHERSDVGVRIILTIALGCILLALIIHVVLLRFIARQEANLAKSRQSSFPVAAEERAQLPPGPGSHPLNGGPRAGQRESLPSEPRLDPINVREGAPRAIVAESYALDLQILNSYGPAREKGFVHIPIERAMTLLDGKLPARKEPAPAPKHDQGLLDWGEPNSGRLFRENPK